MDILLVFEPPAEQQKEMKSLLESRCNKVQLQNYADALVKWMERFDDVKKLTVDGLETYSALLNGLRRANASKDALLGGLALVFADRRNLQAYTDSLSEQMKELWRTLLLNVIVSHDTAKGILGTKNALFKRHTSYGYYYDSRKDAEWNKEELKWFATAFYRSSTKRSFGYRDYEEFITVKSVIHQLFMPVFFDTEIKGTSNEKGRLSLDDEEWSIFDFEGESVAAFHILSAFLEQGELPMKKNGISLLDVKKVQKSINLKEFFADDDNDYHRNLRSQSYLRLLPMAIQLRPSHSAPITSYEGALHELLFNLDRLNSYLPAMLYPHVKGLRKQNYDYGRHTKLCQLMLQTLKEAPGEGKWLRMIDILVHIFTLEPDRSSTRFTAQVFHPDDEQFTSELYNMYCDQIIPADGYVSHFGLPGLEIFAFMLCSLGVVELAVSSRPNQGVSPFDGAEYVRLTPLGRYVLGLTDTYVAPQMEEIAYFELDPDRLIIRSLMEPNPYTQLLLDTSRPISHNRYETSALSFLAYCHKREDVEGKIAIFRRFIAQQLPPLWEQFFQSLLQHCHPLKENRTGYKRYNIDPANRDLINLLTTDARLRSLITRAEGFLILVKSDDLPAFETELKKHGYLL